MYVHFAESLQCVTSVRAFGQQKCFIEKSDMLIDNRHTVDHMGMMMHRYYTFISDSVTFKF